MLLQYFFTNFRRHSVAMFATQVGKWQIRQCGNRRRGRGGGRVIVH